MKKYKKVQNSFTEVQQKYKGVQDKPIKTIEKTMLFLNKKALFQGFVEDLLIDVICLFIVVTFRYKTSKKYSLTNHH